MAGPALLASIGEDAFNPAGSSIAALFDGSSGSFNDADSLASITGVLIADDPANAGTEGVWQYSTDGGSNWLAIGVVTDTSALALDASSQVRFLPAANYNGPAPVLTVYGLDDTFSDSFTSGAARSVVDASARGDGTAISTGGASIGVTVNAVNDAPAASAPASLSGDVDTSIAVTGISFSDVDAGGASVTATLAVTSGKLVAANGGGVTVAGVRNQPGGADGNARQHQRLHRRLGRDLHLGAAQPRRRHPDLDRQ